MPVELEEQSLRNANRDAQLGPHLSSQHAGGRSSGTLSLRPAWSIERTARAIQRNAISKQNKTKFK